VKLGAASQLIRISNWKMEVCRQSAATTRWPPALGSLRWLAAHFST